MSKEYIVKENPVQTTFSTGAKRGSDEGKTRYDLIGAHFLKRLADHLAKGAVQYGEDNWQKGQPIKRTFQSLLRHVFAVREDDTEDHLAAIAFNVMSMIHVIEEVKAGNMSIDLIDLPIFQRYFAQESDQRAEWGTFQGWIIDVVRNNHKSGNKEGLSRDQLHALVAPQMSKNIFNGLLGELFEAQKLAWDDETGRYSDPSFLQVLEATPEPVSIQFRGVEISGSRVDFVEDCDDPECPWCHDGDCDAGDYQTDC